MTDDKTVPLNTSLLAQKGEASPAGFLAPGQPRPKTRRIEIGLSPLTRNDPPPLFPDAPAEEIAIPSNQSEGHYPEEVEALLAPFLVLGDLDHSAVRPTTGDGNGVDEAADLVVKALSDAKKISEQMAEPDAQNDLFQVVENRHKPAETETETETELVEAAADSLDDDDVVELASARAAKEDPEAEAPAATEPPADETDAQAEASETPAPDEAAEGDDAPSPAKEKRRGLRARRGLIQAADVAAQRASGNLKILQRVAFAAVLVLAFVTVLWISYHRGLVDEGELPTEGATAQSQPSDTVASSTAPAKPDLPVQPNSDVKPAGSESSNPPPPPPLPAVDTDAPKPSAEPIVQTRAGTERPVPEAPAAITPPKAAVVARTTQDTTQQATETGPGAIQPPKVESATKPQPVETQPRPAVKPSPPPAAVKRGYAVQLASLKSRTAAERAWGQLQKRFPDLIGNMPANIQVVRRNSGTVYRVLTERAPDRQTAQRLCGQFKARKQDCLVLRR